MNSQRNRISTGDILIVDDTPDNLRVLSCLLSRQGYQVRTVINGRMALTVVETAPPELILLDICMPGLDGYTVCRIIKSNAKTRDIPIIFLSALDEVMDKVKAFGSGGVDYITKPFHIAEVLARVQTHLSLCRLQQQLQEQNRQLQQEVCERVASQAALQAANAELERRANTDGLTQLANRRHFDDRLKQEWRRLSREQQPLSLILCDVDYFKLYNDTYGHLAGDRCLCSIAELLHSVAKRPADLAARYGGEELAVLLPHTYAVGAYQVAQQIQAGLQALEIEHSSSQVSSQVTLSMGIATLTPSMGRSMQELVAAADRALYEAKTAGRNRVATSNQTEPQWLSGLI